MASDERREKAETGMMPEVANLGIVRPPFVYLCAIVLGLLPHFARPVRLVSRAVSVPLGGTAVLVAVALFLYAVRTFRTAGTPVPGNRPTTTIVRTGPLRSAAGRAFGRREITRLALATTGHPVCRTVGHSPQRSGDARPLAPGQETLGPEHRNPSGDSRWRT